MAWRRVFLMFAACAGLALSGCPDVRIARNVDYTKNVVYGLGYVDPEGEGRNFELRELRFDILEPNDIPAINRPALLLLHGGAFRGGSRDQSDLVRFANELASAGYVCFLAEYRLMRDNPPAPGHIADPAERAAHAAFVDAKAAMRHIRARAADYGVNPDRIGVFGESAGAIAAFVVGISGAGDFSRDGSQFPIPAENFPAFSPVPQVIIGFWGSAAPVLDQFDPFDPPIMVVHGLLDTQPGTFYREALNIRSAARANDIPFTLHTLVSHGHRAWTAVHQGKSLAAHTLDFLEEHL